MPKFCFSWFHVPHTHRMLQWEMQLYNYQQSTVRVIVILIKHLRNVKMLVNWLSNGAASAFPILYSSAFGVPAVCYKRYALINLIRCLPQKAWQICLIAIGSLCFTVNLCTHRLPQQVKERSTHWEKAKNNLCNTCWYLQWECNAMIMQWSWQTRTMILVKYVAHDYALRSAWG